VGAVVGVILPLDHQVDLVEEVEDLSQVEQEQLIKVLQVVEVGVRPQEEEEEVLANQVEIVMIHQIHVPEAQDLFTPYFPLLLDLLEVGLVEVAEVLLDFQDQEVLEDQEEEVMDVEMDQGYRLHQDQQIPEEEVEVGIMELMLIVMEDQV
jgi:hypothetical protein